MPLSYQILASLSLQNTQQKRCLTFLAQIFTVALIQVLAAGFDQQCFGQQEMP